MPNLLKTNQWWGYHYMVMLGSFYFVAFISPTNLSPGVLMLRLAIFTIATLGIASFGYVLNDLLDIKQDLRSGHYNIMANHCQLGRFLIFASVLLLGILPWLWLPISPLILILLGLEYVLFLAYSVPPVRLKSRGLLGPIADAVYAYVLPATIAALVANNGELTSKFMIYLIALVIWCFLFGLVGILKHQLFDHSRDQLDGVGTYVVRKGWEAAFDQTFRLSKIVLPIYFLLIVIQGFANAFIFLAFCIHLTWQIWKWNRQSLVDSHCGFPSSRPDLFHLIYDRIVGCFCWYWQPIIILALLTCRSMEFLSLFLAHLVLLPNGIKHLFSVQR